MALRNARPLTFTARGLSDATDASDGFPGAMALLTNLVPKPGSRDWVCRPASMQLTAFAGFVAPAGVTCLYTLGTRVYGMISSGDFAGKDVPFCYDTLTGGFIAISGQTALKLPATQSLAGDWQPPKMEMISTKIIVTHPGFPGGAGVYFGWIDVSNPAAPAWNAGNTTGNALTAVPGSVTQMSGRAWFAVGNNLVFSDSLNPTVVTNATQVLTLGDSLAITALGGVPLNSQLGGVVQAIMAFKGDATIFQITGDSSTGTLAVNQLNNRVGTIAPNSLAATPLGLAFVAADGLRFIDQSGRVTPPVGNNGQGVCVPFINAINPTRIAAGYNENVLRLSVTNGAKANSPREEYWFDINLNIWSGPHTFPADFIAPIDSPNGYVLAASGINGKLWTSQTLPNYASTYVENGAQLSFSWQPVLLPDNQEMAENCITETTLMLALPTNFTLNLQALDDHGAIMDSLALTGSGAPPTIWGSFNWGAANWGSGITNYRQYQLPWKKPLVFKQMTLSASGLADANFIIGNAYLKYQVLGYLLQTG